MYVLLDNCLQKIFLLRYILRLYEMISVDIDIKKTGCTVVRLLHHGTHGLGKKVAQDFFFHVECWCLINSKKNGLYRPSHNCNVLLFWLFSRKKLFARILFFFFCIEYVGELLVVAISCIMCARSMLYVTKRMNIKSAIVCKNKILKNSLLYEWKGFWLYFHS